MRARALGVLFLLPFLAFGASGCMQFGEYAMGGECEALSEDVASVVQEISGAEPAIGELWAGQADAWCEFTVDTGSDLDTRDADRASLTRAVEDVVRESGSGIRVTLLFGDDTDVVTS